jgi:hypothetical protein
MKKIWSTIIVSWVFITWSVAFAGTDSSLADSVSDQFAKMSPCDKVNECLKCLKSGIATTSERQEILEIFAENVQYLSPMYGRSSIRIDRELWTDYLKEGAKTYPDNRTIDLTLTRYLINQKQYAEALKVITPLYKSHPCHEATAWHDYAVYKTTGSASSSNLLSEEVPEFDVHFCVITKNPNAHKKATLDQLKKEVDILNNRFRGFQKKQIVKFNFKSASFYDEVKDIGCKFVELGDVMKYDTHKYAEIFNKCKHSKVRDPKAINFYIYDGYNKSSGYNDITSHGKRNSNRPYLLIDWERLNCNVQNPEAHEMGHAFGLYHVSVPGAKPQSSTNIMCSTEHGFGSGGKRDIGFTEAQTAIILYHAKRTLGRFLVKP